MNVQCEGYFFPVYDQFFAWQKKKKNVGADCLRNNDHLRKVI